MADTTFSMKSTPIRLIDNGDGTFSFSTVNKGSVAIGASTAAPGATSFVINAAGSTNVTVVKGSAANVLFIHAHNASAATRYLKLYNKASGLNPATDVPVMVLTIPAGGDLNVNPGDIPIRFATGLSIAIVTGTGPNDNTAVTAGDVQALISYA